MSEDRRVRARPNARDQVEPPPAIPVTWVFTLSAVVIIAALATVIYSIISAPQSKTEAILAALLCFALSTVSGLIFAARARIEATLPWATITMGGPALVWVGTFMIFTYVSNFYNKDVNLSEVLSKALEGQLHKEGWEPFSSWKADLKPRLAEAVSRKESSHIRYAMDVTYFVGLGKPRPIAPTIDELFVYFDNMTVEFQRVTGSKSKKAEPTQIYTTSYTLSSGTAKSLLLLKREDVSNTVAVTGSDLLEWFPIRDDPLDCLIVTIYPNGLPNRADLNYFSINKYLESGRAVLNVGILALQPIEEPAAWLLRDSPFRVENVDSVPVAFMKTTVPWNTTADATIARFDNWFRVLDQLLEQSRPQHARALDFLKEIKARLPGSSFSDFHKSETFKSRYSARLNRLDRPVAVSVEERQ